MNRQIRKIVQDFSDDTQRILGDNLVAEYLFGSFARNEAYDNSDIDVLIIVKQFDYEIRKRLSGLSSEYSIKHGIYISSIVKEITTWDKNKQYQTLFYQEIKRDGIQLC